MEDRGCGLSWAPRLGPGQNIMGFRDELSFTFCHLVFGLTKPVRFDQTDENRGDKMPYAHLQGSLMVLLPESACGLSRDCMSRMK
jgi:hypothetical protein